MDSACGIKGTVLGDHTLSETITGWEGVLKPGHCCAKLGSQVKMNTCVRNTTAVV